MKRWFITGTDTGIGKTTASVAFLQAGKKKGYSTIGYKPIATGCKITKLGIRSEDAFLLRKYSSIKLNYKKINPISYIEATSPNIASIKENKKIKFYKISKGLKLISQISDFVFIEGIGGWLTPINLKNTFADWVIKENLPVIIVVGIKLGCINHALLTLQSIQNSKLKISGWIANHIYPFKKYQKSYLEVLTKMLKIPFLGNIPYIKEKKIFNNLHKYVILPCNN